VGEIKMRAKFWSEYLEGRDYFGNIGVVWRIILKWTFKIQDVWCGLDESASGWRPVMNLVYP
jgi:hypothetical protein